MPVMKPCDTATAIAAQLNRDCFCIGTDVPGLHRALDSVLDDQDLPSNISQSHPHLFSAAPVFIAPRQLLMMQNVIAAIESVVSMPQWRQATLAQAPVIARLPQAARGVFMGYDFHIEGEGARLIEINTNAGGALLNVALARAQQACCAAMANQFPAHADAAQVEQQIVDMFRSEWQLARGDSPLRCIAIVDTTPNAQYLYPEFLLFQKLFAQHGIEVLILDPNELALRDGGLTYAGRAIDLIYNRLTDFYFANPAHAHLQSAYRNDAAVFTPHPEAHALYANKHNLELLTDVDTLRGWAVPEATIALLQQGIPRTLRVAAMDPAALWQERSHWFFKPATGFGSRGTYRGDKLTRKVFDQIVAGDYVAQALVPPSERMLVGDSDPPSLKLDLRLYSYAGATQIIAARLYQGQTTNFRTSGGGFAPVYRVPDDGGVSLGCATVAVSGISAASKCVTAASSS
jgi:hypothetical protein